jgi:hypothetical protein
MAPMVSSIEIDRRPEDVFAYVTDPSRLSEWQESLVSARGGRRPTCRGLQGHHDPPDWSWRADDDDGDHGAQFPEETTRKPRSENENSMTRRAEEESWLHRSAATDPPAD